mmetsp:Transcript_38773/g.75696  ORF Transcript_38773/g.75696 Transcript_38773/m.75696 type:complete len:686 (+) Transcript_38773:199-2256(+)
MDNVDNFSREVKLKAKMLFQHALLRLLILLCLFSPTDCSAIYDNGSRSNVLRNGILVEAVNVNDTAIDRDRRISDACRDKKGRKYFCRIARKRPKRKCERFEFFRNNCPKTCGTCPEGGIGSRKNPYNYVYGTYNSFESDLMALAEEFPQFLTVTTAQEKYGLPSAGGYDVFIVTIQDKNRYGFEGKSLVGKKLWESMPEVLINGNLHGDERVGPTVTVETIRLLVLSASCVENKGSGTSCAEMERHTSSAPWTIRWLARLVSTRRIVVLPTPNAWGYALNRRTDEWGIDPNRDFSYDPQWAGNCMQTVAARSINEVVRESLFQLSVVFHGGITMIAYEWGSFTHPLKFGLSPDDEGQNQIGTGLSDYCGSFSTSRKYPVGSINEIVYPVYGGLEDWIYAGSWDTKYMEKCIPTSYGGYPAQKTTYGPSSLRSVMFLVETSDKKQPETYTLGSDEDLFNPSGAGNGEVSRNIRLNLMVIDLVEPYTSIIKVNGNDLPSDISTGVPVEYSACKTKKMIRVSKRSQRTIEWMVGGAMTVDVTRLVYSRWEDVPTEINCALKPTEDQYVKYRNSVKTISSPPQKGGKTRWNNASEFNGIAPPGTVFSAVIDLSSFSVGDRVAVFAVSKVDQSWKKPPDGAQPNVMPQSHVVNARTNPDWFHESESGSNKIIRGRLHWMSVPITLKVVR